MPSRLDRTLWSVVAAGLSVALASAAGPQQASAPSPVVATSSVGPGASDGCARGAGKAACPLLFALGPDDLSDAAHQLAPGDTASRLLDISNDKGGNLASISLSVSADPATGGLVADPAAGLQLHLTRCSKPWTSTALRTYRCDGTTLPVLSERPVLVRSTPLQNLSSLQQGGRDHVLVTLRLPDGTGDNVLDSASALTYSFTATTRSGRA